MVQLGQREMHNRLLYVGCSEEWWSQLLALPVLKEAIRDKYTLLYRYK